MRWHRIALLAWLSLASVAVTDAQDSAPRPSSEVACRVDPFTALSGFDS